MPTHCTRRTLPCGTAGASLFGSSAVHSRLSVEGYIFEKWASQLHSGSARNKIWLEDVEDSDIDYRAVAAYLEAHVKRLNGDSGASGPYPIRQEEMSCPSLNT